MFSVNRPQFGSQPNLIDTLLNRMPSLTPAGETAEPAAHADRLLLSSSALRGRPHPLPPGEQDEAHAALRALASKGIERADAARTKAEARKIATDTLEQMQQTVLGQDSMTLAGTLAALLEVEDDATGVFLAKDALVFLASGHLSVESTHLYDLALETIQQASPRDAFQIGVAYLEAIERLHPEAAVRAMASSGLQEAHLAFDPKKAVTSLVETFDKLRFGKMHLA